jgi:hypothetical protein
MYTRLERTQVLLDNQAHISSMLPHLEPVDSEVKITGVGVKQLVAKQTGYLKVFFDG